MRAQIRQRTSEEQQIYDAVIGRLLAGEKPKRLAKEFNVDAGKLRVWKCAASRRAERDVEQIERAAQIALPTFDETIAPTVETLLDELSPQLVAPAVANNDAALARYDNVVRAESLRGVLLEQATNGAALLPPLRDDLWRGVKSSSAALVDAIEFIRNALATKRIARSKWVDENLVTIESPIESSDIGRLAQSLKQSLETLTALHCVPFGAVSTSALQLAETASGNAQHLHLHSHGGRVTEPARVKRDIIAASNEQPVAASTELDESQQSLLDSV